MIDKHWRFLNQNYFFFLAKFLTKNFYFWPKFEALTEILIFDRNSELWPNFWFLTEALTENFIFDRNSELWPKFLFLTEIRSIDQNFELWQKFWFLTENSELWPKFSYLDHFCYIVNIPKFISSKIHIFYNFYGNISIFCNHQTGHFHNINNSIKSFQIFSRTVQRFPIPAAFHANTVIITLDFSPNFMLDGIGPMASIAKTPFFLSKHLYKIGPSK